MAITSFSLNGIGNRLTEEQGETTKTYIYPEENSRLQAVDGTSLTYDDAGNITNDGTRSYVINAAGDLASISLADTQTGSYAYDANHLRTQKTTASSTTYYVYGQGGMLYGEYKADGTPIREYVYLHGEPLAQIDSNAPAPLSDNVLYLHTDHLGTPRYATDASANQVWAWNADAFGQTVASGTQEVNLRFEGQYYDSESGLHYNWHRYYDPALGRYITSDPIGLEGGLNTYAYAGANPVMAIDPEGLNPRLIYALGSAAFRAGEHLWNVGKTVLRSPATILPIAFKGGKSLGLLAKDITHKVCVRGKSGTEVFEDVTNSALKQFGRNVDDLSSAASQPFKNTGLTKAARALDKHAAGQRSSGTFPPLSGNAAARNKQAQRVVDDILNNSKSEFKTLSRGGLEVRSPSGQGIRFNKDGYFSGFVD